jgi:hypothetical protein
MTPTLQKNHIPQAEQVIRLARETLDIESDALLGLKSRVGEPFVRAVELMLNVSGRVVVMGMGKAGTSAARRLRRWPLPERLPCLCTPRKPAMAIWA